jgi:hypothetical protein
MTITLTIVDTGHPGPARFRARGLHPALVFIGASMQEAKSSASAYAVAMRRGGPLPTFDIAFA